MTPYSFVAVIGQVGDPSLERIRRTLDAAVNEHDWTRLFDSSGAAVFSAPNSLITPRAFENGIVLGRLFSNSAGYAEVKKIDRDLSHALLQSGGGYAISHFWGQYTIVLGQCDREPPAVIRSPGQSRPIFYIPFDSSWLISTDLRLLQMVGLLRPSISWVNLSSHLTLRQLRLRSTCLNDVSEIAPGAKLIFDPDGHKTSDLWSPWTFARPSPEARGSTEAAEAVRNTVLDVTAALASTANRILLNLSGGLDSSILAFALSKSATPFDSVTLATEESIGDERTYAKCVADHLQVRHFERFERLDGIDPFRSHAMHLPRPTARLFAQSGDMICETIASETGADVFMTGAGGDNVFCFLRSIVPVVDRWLAENWSTGVWSTLKDVCSEADVSLIAGVLAALKRRRAHQKPYAWRQDLSFLSAEHTLSGGPDHPWLRAPRGSLPGTGAHIRALMQIENHLEGFRRELSRPVIAPLLAQPLVELCLSIPTWQWCEGGIDRAIARKAFDQDLPRSIIQRRSKGSPVSFVGQVYERYRSEIRSLLLDGLLAEHHVIDRSSLERYFSSDSGAHDTRMLRIMELVDAEVWARSWSGN